MTMDWSLNETRDQMTKLWRFEVAGGGGGALVPTAKGKCLPSLQLLGEGQKLT